MLLALVAASCINTVLAAKSETANTHWIQGIGYREQELQIAKGTKFASEDATGCPYVSFAGNTNIFIKGLGLADNPQSNAVVLFSQEFEMEIPSLPLTEDDAFGSFPLLGSISYRLPSIDALMGMPMNYFDKYDTMTFELRLIAEDADLGPVPMSCRNPSNCRIVYQKQYTPVMYFLKPPVVYFESLTELWFDPRRTPNLIQDLDQDEMQFINAKLGNSLLDFEFNVDFDTSFAQYNKNRVTGQVGELPIGDYNISMQWETGKALTQKI